MPIYKEKPGKLNFSIVENTHPVKITLTNEYGTVSSISYGWPSKNLNNDHLSDEVGDYQLLENNTVIFSGESNNPSGSNNTLKNTVNQTDNAQVLTTIFLMTIREKRAILTQLEISVLNSDLNSNKMKRST